MGGYFEKRREKEWYSLIQVVLITDERYMKFAATTIASVLNTAERDVSITCIVSDISEETVSFYEEKFSESVQFLRFDEQTLRHIKAKHHVSRAAYIKIFLPEILKTMDRVIFLDSDILVMRDIGELWDRFEDTYSIQAVWDPGYDGVENEILGLSPTDKTFNSGVMLMNLSKMRQWQETEQLATFVEEKNHLTILNDQAAFNAVYAHKWGALPLKWNVQYHFYFASKDDVGLTKIEKTKLLNEPWIVHFSTHSKPWMFRNNHPLKSKFRQVFETINGRLRYQDVNMSAFAKKVKESFTLMKYKNK